MDDINSSDQEASLEFQNARVVIVDDNQVNRIMLRNVCEKIGIGSIEEAEDGVEAFEIIMRKPTDMVLLDICMPRMDGLALMKKLREDPVYDGLSILVETGLQSEAERVRCFGLGATDVITRPFHMAELKARIGAHLRSAISSRVLFDFRNRIQAHIEITRTFLDAILPGLEETWKLADSYGLSCSSVYRPHDEIGGDLWFLRAIDKDHLGIVLVDASAHGLAGAINALRVDCLVQEYQDELSDPGRFLSKLDTAMAKISFGQLFAGSVALTINKETGAIRYAGSGIPSPLLIHNGVIIELKTKGLPLGSGMTSLTTSSTTLCPGAALVLYSDGWSESLTEEPEKILKKSKVDDLNLAATLAQGCVLVDDLTLIALYRR